VSTASGNKADIIGTGNATVGGITLTDVQHVPEFTHDLVSGTCLVKNGYDQLLTKNGDLFVSRDGKTLATGSIDRKSNLVRFHIPLRNRFDALNTILEDVPEDLEKESTVSQPESTVNDNRKTMDINKAQICGGMQLKQC
jgi:hypothetical protein